MPKLAKNLTKVESLLLGVWTDGPFLQPFLQWKSNKYYIF